MGVHVDYKTSNFFSSCDYDFWFAHGPWKLMKIYKFRPQGATILGVIN
jgi:hypothetical protein